MRKILLTLLLCLAPVIVSAQTTITSGSPAIWNTSGQGSISIQVTGISGGGTITWACSVDNTNFVSYLLTPVGSTTAAATTTSNGIYAGPLGPCNSFRASISAGSATVFQRTIVAVKDRGTGGGGGGTVTSIATTSPITGGTITTTGTIECSTCVVDGDFGTGVATALAVNVGSAGSFQIQLFKQATVNLTDAQVKALPTTPISLVSAPGANKINIPVTIFFRGTIAVAYTNFNAVGQCGITYASSGGDPSSYVPATEFLNPASPPKTPWVLLPATQLELVFAGAGVGPNVLLGDSVNKALNVSCFNGGSDFTGGDAANSVRVSIIYVTFDTTNGTFS